MQKNHGKNGVMYLRCALAAKTKGKECTLHTIRLEALEEAVENRIRKMLTDFIKEEGIAETIEALLKNENEYEKALNAKNMAIAEAEEKKKKLIGKTLMAYNDRAEGILSEAVFAAVEQSAEEEIRLCEERIAAFKEERENLKKKISERGKTDWRKYIEQMKISRQTVEECIDYIEIGEKQGKEQEINIHWRF